MYSYAGPVIVEPSAFLAIGISTAWVWVVPRFARDTPSGSHPLHTSVYPRGIRNEFSSIAGSVMVAGSLPPPVTRPKAVHVLPPRLGGSYIILPWPLSFGSTWFRLTGLRM